MVHKTGPRPEVLADLLHRVEAAVVGSGATITECLSVFHAIQTGIAHKVAKPWEERIPNSAAMFLDACYSLHAAERTLIQGMLRPWEDETCPTCAKADHARY